MRNDWVDVRLTEFGARQAGDGVLRISEGNGGEGFQFRAGETQRVTRAFDWERVLKPWHHHGHPLFEIVPSAEEEAEVERLNKLGIHATPGPDGPVVDVPKEG